MERMNGDLIVLLCVKRRYDSTRRVNALVKTLFKELVWTSKMK